MAKPPTIMDNKAGKVPRWVEAACMERSE
ncbi:hypothetical protein AvCA_35910 [Azotobacter vinelandii CA]|uniref:Uncharacterized protein n=2 Tax=Azotobacter vinelandii TaxID=354 RepID=C1DR80_AZOVD|nr:hypothetical protein Avin_35910 [Azotobacter vinelandii DJ]AGK14587.1 hypothetical protein AvCA_35910 [Azotobacter vinelandii CA]AGK21456.1 hypothetical protein AvCA6_35910 [Azotobacter vinelandii CA6]